MRRWIWLALATAWGTSSLLAATPVRSYQGTITIPTYEHSGRETQPALFPNSSVTGIYPFTTYLMPFKGPAQPKQYGAVFLENEYLKVTYLPAFGGRFFSVYDKLRQREMFYRNDVIKPAGYNPRNSWAQSGMELTGPHDLHTLTLYGEPFWGHKVVPDEDGSVSLVLGENDPVYGMRVELAATLHPGIAALQISVTCYNSRDGRKPQMFWINSAINATPKTRFIYPMSRTVGHTTAEIADWPLYNGVDYSWDRNNKHMLGVFGIDSYDNFQGAYQFDRDYGIFRFADRRVVQGMKLWTFGYGPGSKSFEEGYTDKAGPYVELQSGRHVWDGHYEWMAPHKRENWTEWWIPVSQTGGLTTLTRDLALNLEVEAGKKAGTSAVKVVLYPTRVISGARLTVEAQSGALLQKTIDFDPSTTYKTEIGEVAGGAEKLHRLTVKVVDSAGRTLLIYQRPDKNPGRQEYTPFTKPLESARKSRDEMSVEELTLAGESRLKELDEAGAQEFFDAALKRDPNYSRAHLQMGITAFTEGRYEQAIQELNKTIERDPYGDAAYYYLAMSQFAVDATAGGERNLYYIWPASAYYGEREYQLGRLALGRNELVDAKAHFEQAIEANGYDLLARAALALVERKTGNQAAAEKQILTIEKTDPTSEVAAAEHYLLTKNSTHEQELLRLTGGQTQEAISLTMFYRQLGQWQDAAKILKLVKKNGQDPFGTTPVFFYTLAYCERRAGDATAAAQSLQQAREASGKVDRFPYREETGKVLAEAIRLNPADATAQYELGCWLYYWKKQGAAIKAWEAALAAKPDDFSTHRALGLAYAAQGFPTEKAAAQLERAVELNPAHTRTLDDLSSVYARAGRFGDQLAVLQKAFERSPSDDELAEAVLAADLNEGHYNAAEQLIHKHEFAPRHRTYTLRDKYRIARYGEGAKSFQRGDYKRALALFESALKPPVSLGIDDFQSQTSARLEYYIGRTLEALGQQAEARQAYQKSIAGMDQLSGDRDSWNSENFFIVLALDRLGRKAEANKLAVHFANFAATERDSDVPEHRAQARYLLSLIAQRDGKEKLARSLLQGALEARPDLLAARLAMRGDDLNSPGQEQR